MFYRYTKSGARISADLDGVFCDATAFILGGSPKLKDERLDLLRQPGIVTIAMNNVPILFPRPDIWVCADKPPCFDQRIYADPSIMKFTIISRRLEAVGSTGKRVMDFPNMYFFGTSADYTPRTFLRPGRDLVWWKSVFPIALQLAFRMGFRRVFLVGCGFKMDGNTPYAWKADLNDYEQNYSRRTYASDVDRLRSLKPSFNEFGFEVISATADSAANGILEYVSLEDAISIVLRDFPEPSDKLIHSSALGVKR